MLRSATRTAGRTALIAGTATAVAGGVGGAMASSAQQRAAAEQQRVAAAQQELNAAVQEALAQQQIPTEEIIEVDPMAVERERIAMLQQLAELKNQGILTDAEFAAEKARILAL